MASNGSLRRRRPASEAGNGEPTRPEAVLSRATFFDERMRLTLDNWRQGLRDAANRAGLPRFWRWWIGELAPLLPAASRAAIRRRFARPVIELADGEAVFWRPDFGD